jgi:hypothetical protein
MSQGFTRGVPIDTDPTLSLDSDLVVPSQKAVKTYVDTGLSTKQDTLTATKSVEIVSNNVELDGDLTTPLANYVYGTDGLGARGWKPDPTGGGNSIEELTSDVTAGPAGSPSASVAATLAASYKSGSASVVFDGAGGVITSGTTGYAQVLYNGTITSWTIAGNVSGSCTVTVFKDTYANFPPLITSDNVFTVQPALAAQQKNQNLAPVFLGSQATVAAGDWIGFTITGITTLAWVNLTIAITKTV